MLIFWPLVVIMIAYKDPEQQKSTFQKIETDIHFERHHRASHCFRSADIIISLAFLNIPEVLNNFHPDANFSCLSFEEMAVVFLLNIGKRKLLRAFLIFL